MPTGAPAASTNTHCLPARLTEGLIPIPTYLIPVNYTMRYTPFESMDRLFEQMRREMGGAGWGDAGPSMDLTERDGAYVFTADVPGFSAEEIDLRYDDGHLALSAVQEEHEEYNEGDEGSYVSSRRRSVSERVRVPGDVIVEEITASYHNGVLEVHLPVEGDGESGHSIEIN